MTRPNACSRPLPGRATIATGDEFTVQVRPDGTVMASGLNSDGQLGDGTTTTSTTPVPVSGLTPGSVVAVAAGDSHALALKADGTVVAWGTNSAGQLGDGTTTASTTPVTVSGLTGVTAIAAGDSISYALKVDGTVWAWGTTTSASSATGPTPTATTPVQVSGLAGVTSIAAGAYHGLAAKADGTVWAWGYGADGQLGNSATAEQDTPVQATGLSRVVAVAGGAQHSAALRADGTVWTWGLNNHGQLGDGTTTASDTPVQATGVTGAVAIAGHNVSTAAVTATGALYGWGVSGDNGIAYSDETTPQHVTGLPPVTILGNGPTAYTSVHGTAAGVNYAYGDNANGAYGASITSTATPSPVSAGPVTSATGDEFTINIRADGAVTGTGRNSHGQLGDNTTTNATAPVTVSGITAGTVTAVAAGNDHALALKTDGTVLAWGANVQRPARRRHHDRLARPRHRVRPV